MDEPNANVHKTKAKSPGFMQMVIPTPGEESFVTKVIVVTVLLGSIMIGGYFLLHSLFKKKPIDPIYSKIEGIKRVRDLRLVKHHYESIIPITKTKGNKQGKDGEFKEGELQFVLVAPSEISGYVDMGRVKMRVKRDSLVEVKLPPPSISKVRIDLDNVKEYGINRKGMFFGKRVQNLNYFKVYEGITRGLRKAKISVQKRALINGIKEDTHKRAEDYVRNMVNGMGYRVEFVEKTTPDSLRIDLDFRKKLGDFIDENAPEDLNKTSLLKRLGASLL